MLSLSSTPVGSLHQGLGDPASGFASDINTKLLSWQSHSPPLGLKVPARKMSGASGRSRQRVQDRHSVLVRLTL